LKLSDTKLPISGSVWLQKKLSWEWEWDWDEGGPKLPDNQIERAFSSCGLLRVFRGNRDTEITINKKFPLSEFQITCDKHLACKLDKFA